MRNATIWEFGLALFVLWLIMEFIPGGIWAGAAVLFVAFLSTPAATDTVANLLDFVQTGQYSHPQTTLNTGIFSNPQLNFPALQTGSQSGGGGFDWIGTAVKIGALFA